MLDPQRNGRAAGDQATPRFDPDPARPLAFLAHCPAHQPTPLVELPGPSGERVLLKDERNRLGLGSHKGLGGVYAVAQLILQQWQEAGGEPLAPGDLLRADVKTFAGGLTFLCASAGNHGLAVATGARLFGARPQILLSEQVPAAFASRLEALGADVVRAGADYDASIAAAIQLAGETGAIHLPDGSWPGMSEAPSLVMEGYTVIAEELRTAFQQCGAWPTDVFLPGGVGGTAAPIAQMIRRNWQVQPRIHVIEPEAAMCLAASRQAGVPTTVDGPASIIARLDCKAASHIAFFALEDALVLYRSVCDPQAEAAVNWLHERGLPTTPSGAASVAGLLALAQTDRPADWRPLALVCEACS